jgi:hypothetical protein
LSAAVLSYFQEETCAQISTVGGDSASSSRTETLTISAQQIQFSSTPQSADGSTGATATTEIDCQNGTIQ